VWYYRYHVVRKTPQTRHGRGAKEMSGDFTVFGEFFREMLISKEMSLREVARRSGIDASNLSKMERGVAYPPQKREILQKLARALFLDEEETRRLIELAALVNGMIPEDLENVKKNKAIPMLLRAIDNKQLDEKQTAELARLIEEENAWQGRVVD
jgi:transcriptional regulator with XRE-family HTH domain